MLYFTLSTSLSLSALQVPGLSGSEVRLQNVQSDNATESDKSRLITTS